jgi:hypothetical protein
VRVLLDLCGLKIIKSIFGVVAAIWALALIPQFVDAVSHIARPHAWGIAAGSILGMVLASTISVVFFRKAFAPASAMANKEVQVSNLSRCYNVVLPLIALAGLAFEVSSMYQSISWATLCVKLGISDVKVVQMLVIFVWVGMIGFGLVALLHAAIVMVRPLKLRIQPRWLSHVAFFLCLAHVCGSVSIAGSRNFQRYYQLFSSQ